MQAIASCAGNDIYLLPVHDQVLMTVSSCILSCEFKTASNNMLIVR